MQRQEQPPVVKTRAEKIFDDLATGFACLQVQFGINMSKAVILLNDLALLFKESETKREKYELALHKLSKLGNEPHLGNSDGNVIAQQALGIKLPQ